MPTIDVVVTRFIQQNVGGLRRDLGYLAGDFFLLESRIARSQETAARAAAIGATGLGIITTIVRKSLQAAGEVQRVETGYLTVLRNSRQALELSRQVRTFDVKTPFSYLETAKASQMLLAAGFRQDLIPTMYAIGNATIAAGKGTDTFIRALAVMAKIKTAGILTSVRVHQFAAAGINIKEILRKELGLTDEQMINVGRLKLKADVVIPALIRGLNDQFKGGIEMGAKSYLGKIETLKGSIDKLFASTGKVFMPDASNALSKIIALTGALDNFVSVHPRLTKMLFTIGAVGSTALALKGAAEAFGMASMAKKALTIATEKDTVAEAKKAIVAGVESKAVGGVGKTAATTATAVENLATTTNRSSRSLRTIIQDMKIWWNSPLATGGASTLGGAAAGRYKKSPRGWVDTVTGALVDKNVVDQNTMALEAGAANQGVRGWMMRTPKSSVATSVAIGAAAGYGAYDDYSKMGDPNAEVKGATLGIVAAIASMFLPGAAIPIAIATGFRYVFNELVNVPMEREAEQGVTDENGNLISEKGTTNGRAERNMSPDQLRAAAAAERDKAMRLNQLADRDASQRGDTEYNEGLRAEAQSHFANAMRMQKNAAKMEKDARTTNMYGNTPAMQAAQDAWFKKRAQERQKADIFTEGPAPTITRRDEDMGGGVSAGSSGVRAISVKEMGSEDRRDGVTVATFKMQIAQRESDKESKKRKLKSFTPAPVR